MKYLFTLLFFTVIISLPIYGQKDTVYVPDTYDKGGQEGTLNNAVDSVINAGGNLSNVVFKLKPYGLYVLSGTITTPAGQVFEIDADPPGTTQETAPPMVAWTESTAPNKTYYFDVAGTLIMNNIWLLWSGTNGTRFASTIRIGDSASVSGGRVEANNVIFDYVDQSSSGAIQPYATHFKGYFKNCYFRNCTDNHFRYYSRAVSFPYNTTGLHNDTVSFENCTFANIGYVYMQEGAEYGDNVFFNHCTFYNVVMYTLESGWWWKMYVTNSLFVNTYMFGRIPVNDGATGVGGTIQIAPIDSNSLGSGFGFSVPFTEQDRRILFANNNYYIEQWLVDWMGYGPNGNPYSKDKHKNREDDEIPVPMPAINGATKTFFDSTNTDGSKAYPYMNMANLDSLNPGFVNPPLNLDSLKQFMYHKWYDNADVNWSWKPENSYQKQLWPSEESLSYTDDTLKVAAMGGFPLGDLYHWFPAQYTQWKAQEDAEHTRINTWLETGKDPTVGIIEVKGTVPAVYTLSQNYPNPFNPTTKIDYSIPKSGFVSLKVFNLLGQEVATLYNGNQKAGNYEATFNGANLASGVYMYRLQSDNVSITKKFVLMK
jgi:hypothetical protein